jgi:hypothetical protein
VGGGSVTASWWVGSLPATSRVASRPSLGLGVAATPWPRGDQRSFGVARRPPHGWLEWSRVTPRGRQGEKRLPAAVSVANMVEAGWCSNLRGIIVYFVLILIFCNFLKLLMCQLMRG